MPGTRLLRPVLAAAGAAALAAMAGLVPARGATTAGWQVAATVGQNPRVTYLLDPGGGNAGAGFTATGATDAWSVWGSCDGSCGNKPATIVERWDGTAWHRVPTAGLSLTSTDAVAAASATDAWLFEGYDNNATALHWDGTAWTSSTLPPWAIRFNESGVVQIAAADFGASDVWIFTLGQQGLSPQVPYAGHFNGKAWVKRKLPAIPDEVAAVAPNDIWALGTPGNLSGGQVLMHWNGQAWGTLALPTPTVPPGDSAFFNAPASSGPSDLWLEQYVAKNQGSPGTTSLEHWNGTAWQPVPLHYRSSSVDATASDGSGGLWMIFNGPRPGFTDYFAHLASGGSWTRTVVPASTGTTVQQASVITAVPGSASVWAAGELIVPGQGSGGIIGSIWQH
jgi:hypothetical protein